MWGWFKKKVSAESAPVSTAPEPTSPAVTDASPPAEIVEQRGLKQVTDTGAIEQAVDAIVAANPKQVEAGKANPKALGWFVGQVMKATGGKANPQAVNDILKRKLGI